MITRFCLLTGLFVALAGPCRAGQDEVASALEEAKARFARTASALRAEAETAIDWRLARARQAGDRQLVEELRGVRKELNEDRRIPPFAGSIAARYFAARGRVLAAFDRAVSEYTKLESDQEAEEADEEKKTFGMVREPILPEPEATGGEVESVTEKPDLFDELDRAGAAYTKALEAAVQKLSSKIVSEMESAAKGRPMNGRAPPAAEAALEEAHRRLLTTGRVPWSKSVLGATGDYLTAISNARSNVSSAYDRAVTDLRKGARSLEASTVRSERDAVAGPVVIAELTYNGVRRTLFTDQSIGFPGGTDGKWKFTRANSTFEFVFPNPKAPMGRWVDTLRIADDGRSISGRNNKNRPVGGTFQ